MFVKQTSFLLCVQTLPIMTTDLVMNRTILTQWCNIRRSKDENFCCIFPWVNVCNL